MFIYCIILIGFLWGLKMTEEFSDKAGRLLDRINSISLQDKTDKITELQFNNLYKTEPKKLPFSRQVNVGLVSPQTQTAIELGKI